MTRKGDL